MSSSNTSPSTRLTIKEFLEIHLIAYNAAATAFRPHSVLSFGTSDLGDNYMTVTIDLLSRGILPGGTTEAQAISYKKMNQCDTFCLMFLGLLKERLQLYEARVESVVVDPNPITMLVTHEDPEPHVLHAVLQVRTKDDSEIIFDGTTEQFGWPESNAIIDGEEFWDVYVCKIDNLEDSEDEEFEDLKRYGKGYWHRVATSFREMLSGLNWESLAGMSPSEREEYIRVQAAERASAAAQLTWG